MKLLPLLLAIITITCTKAQSIVTDSTVHDAIIKKDNQVKILYFTASWCGPCQAMKPIMKELDEDEQLNLGVYTLDTDSNMADNYLNINSIPAFYYFKNGVLVGSSVGAKRAVVIKKMVRKYDKLNPTGAPFIFVTEPSRYNIIEGKDPKWSLANLKLLWNDPADLRRASHMILEDYDHPKDLACGLQLALRSLEIKPNNTILFTTARFLDRLNRPEEALATAQELLQSDDLSRRLKKKVVKFMEGLR
jgi:thioredoxin 1